MSTIDIALNIEEINMPKLTPVTTRAFQKIRKEAVSLSKELGIKLHEAQQITAEKHGFKHWKQFTDAKKLFDERSQLCQNHPVFFWDSKDIGEFENGSTWLRDDLAVEICYDLLWKKPRISRCYIERKEWLEGVIYTKRWSSFEQLDIAAIGLMMRSPEYVFIHGCFIPFEELRKSSQNINELESIETTLVIFDEVEPYLTKLRADMSSAVLDFSNQFYWDLGETSLFNAFGWTGKQTGDFVADLYIEQVILISPPEDVATSVKRRLGNHLVHIVDLDF